MVKFYPLKFCKIKKVLRYELSTLLSLSFRSFFLIKRLNFRKIIQSLILLPFLVSCSSLDRNTVRKLESLLQKDNVDGAVKFSLQKTFYKDKRSQILKYLERGTLFHYKGDYLSSLDNLNIALNISQKLFTVSISKKIGSQIIGEGSDNYYPKQYENSLIRFYIVLNQFLLSQDANRSVKEKRVSLLQAKASLLEWDSFQNELMDKRAGTPLFKRDILSNILGSYVHRKIKTQSDRNIAKKLLENGKDLFFINSNMYPSFNKRFVLFLKDFKKLPKMKRSKVSKDYVDMTTHAKKLMSYLKKEKKSKPSYRDVNFFIHESWIAPIKPKQYSIPLFLNTTGSNYGYGFTTFARVLAGGDFIRYELPEIPLVMNKKKRRLVFVHESTQKEITRPLALMAPLSDISYRTFQDEIIAYNLKVGARLITKHIAALVSAHAAYQNSIRAGQGEFIANLLASGLYAAFNRGIAESEKADIRKWISLPQNIFVGKATLSIGNYLVYFEKVDYGGAIVRTFLTQISISKNEKTDFYNFKVP